MADATGHTPSAVTLFGELAREPWAYGFFQALRLLEAAHPDRPRLGKSTKADADPVRLTQEATLRFAPAALSAFRVHPTGGPPRLSVECFGLLGPNGPLPTHLTEFAHNRQHHFGDRALVDFLGVFHHRMLSLFYRAWADAQPTVQLDRPQQERFSVYVGALCGMGLPSQRERDSAPDNAKWFAAGRLANQRHCGDDLEGLLEGFFAVPVTVQGFVGRWMIVPEPCRWRLGESTQTGALGRSIVVGGRSWECQETFRVRLGPLSLADYRRLLPGGRSCQRLQDLVKLAVGLELSWELNLVLDRHQVPPLRLGGDVQLGLTTWLSSRLMERDPDDFRKDYQEAVA